MRPKASKKVRDRVHCSSGNKGEMSEKLWSPMAFLWFLTHSHMMARSRVAECGLCCFVSIACCVFLSFQRFLGQTPGVFASKGLPSRKMA